MNVKYLLFSVLIIAAAAAVLLGMGRIPFCKCGEISLWSSDVTSNQQSQQFADPYTFTHAIHGTLFYFFIWFVFGRRFTAAQRLVLAVALEAGWEILENTDFIINRYRAVTFSYDYYGDSVFNSVGDIVAMATGYLAAWKLPWKITVIGSILLDLVLLLTIHDSLAVNIIMLIHPIEAIKNWQLKQWQ